jgi:hypothetical protein
MSSEISIKKANKTLEKAVNKYDWATEFLGEDKKEIFLDRYRAFHAQLKPGDELKIEVNKLYTEKNGARIFEPWFKIVLYKTNGSRENVFGIDTEGNILLNKLLGLYSD